MNLPRYDGARPITAGDVGRQPEQDGWALWEDGCCSIARCDGRSVAAIERVARQRRPAHWQPYCEQHAMARGVERQGDELVWTAAFLTPSRREEQVERTQDHGSSRRPSS